MIGVFWVYKDTVLGKARHPCEGEEAIKGLLGWCAQLIHQPAKGLIILEGFSMFDASEFLSLATC